MTKQKHLDALTIDILRQGALHLTIPISAPKASLLTHLNDKNFANFFNTPNEKAQNNYQLQLSQRLGYSLNLPYTQNQIPVRDQVREDQLLVRLIQQGQKVGLDPHYVTQLFHVIIEESVLNQQAMLARWANPGSEKRLNRVAFLGDKGSYSYLATKKYFFAEWVND